MWAFLSTLSLRRATFGARCGAACVADFYPRSPCGERPYTTTTTICIALFLSTLSLRRATGCFGRFAVSPAYFYPRSPCGERLKISFLFRLPKKFLSTLSLRRATSLLTLCPFLLCRFLSTLSLRRATGIIDIINNVINHFYPRSPCGERPPY